MFELGKHKKLFFVDVLFIRNGDNLHTTTYRKSKSNTSIEKKNHFNQHHGNEVI